MSLETNAGMNLRDKIFTAKQLRINSYRQKMAVSVIVGLSGVPHGSYCTFSDTLGNSINRPVLPRRRKRERGRESEPRIDVDAPFFRSSGYVKARAENCRRIRLEWRIPSAREVESYPEIRVWSRSRGRRRPSRRRLARGMHYFAAWKCRRTGNRCRIA